MGTFQDTLRELKPWQAALLIAIVLGVAGAVYGVYLATTDSTGGGVGLEDNQQLVPVQLGDLANQISTSGNLTFPNRESATFDFQGTVGEVMVEEGQRVVEGQPLARLDDSTVASLEELVAQSQINLKKAQDALTDANNPHSALDLAQAEAGVVSAKLSLENARDALDALSQPKDGEIAKAQLALTNARLAVEKAREDMDALKAGPAEEDIVRARADVKAKEVALANTLEDLRLAK